ncbi:MAG: tyrosine recombinase XerC [Rhodocyclales bacterium]|nr:tyrosine recombinase XerC [Rhodocyclales bacterium]
MSPMAAVDAWLAELSNQRRLSPHTLAAYRRDLDKLLASIGEQTLAEVQAHQIRRAVAQLHAQGLGGRSLARLLSAWRGFFAWLGERGLVRSNPCEGLKPPKSPQRLPKALSVDEAMQLLETEEDSDDPWQSCRDLAMFELFYSSGLRLAELVALNLDALDSAQHEGEIRVLGKRSKARIVPVGSQARAALAAWSAMRGELALADEPALFVGKRGRRINPRVVEARLARWAIRSGLPAQVHPHMLRHSFASHVLQSSGDLRAVQEMLGHASIASTQVYTHLDFQHLAKVYDQAHPRAKQK